MDWLNRIGEALAPMFLSFMEVAFNWVSIAMLGFVALNVLILMLSIYLRPIRTKKQFAKMMLYLFAVTAICCMTVWWYLNYHSESADSNWRGQQAERDVEFALKRRAASRETVRGAQSRPWEVPCMGQEARQKKERV